MKVDMLALKVTEVFMMQTQSLKDELANMVQSLPEDCTIEDVQYRLYVINKVRRGEERLAKEGGISQEEMKKRLSSRWAIK